MQGRSGKADAKCGLMDTVKEGVSGTNGESSINGIYTLWCRMDSWQEVALQHREPSPVLCDDLEGWNGGRGGRLEREGGCMCNYE